jgi:hypothetical protein
MIKDYRLRCVNMTHYYAVHLYRQERTKDSRAANGLTLTKHKKLPMRRDGAPDLTAFVERPIGRGFALLAEGYISLLKEAFGSKVAVYNPTRACPFPVRWRHRAPRR